MAISLSDARLLSDDILEAFRLRGRERGFTEADSANLLGVSRATVCRWWSASSSGGLDALPHERPDAPRARDDCCPRSKPATSNSSWISTVPKSWACLRRCGIAALSAT